MIRYQVKQSQAKFSKGAYYASPYISETMDLAALSQHMAEHNTPFSKGTIYGVLCDMVKCVKEMVLSGVNVKLDDLAIFSVGIKNRTGGAASQEEFNTTKHIEGVKLRARATGNLSNSSLDLEASLKKINLVNGEGTSSPGSSDFPPITPPSGGGNSSGGSSGGGSGNGGGGDDFE